MKAIILSRTLPAPRPGLLGSWDRFVGPGMTIGENILVIGVGVLSAAIVAWHLAFLGFEWWRIGLGALLALDVLGGAVCNMTDTTKRWYHRAGQAIKDHISFTALHVLHIMLVAWAFRGEGFDAVFALASGGWLLLSSMIVLRAPDLLKGPIATTLYLAALWPAAGFSDTRLS